jgi:hypothetical protein
MAFNLLPDSRAWLPFPAAPAGLRSIWFPSGFYISQTHLQGGEACFATLFPVRAANCLSAISSFPLPTGAWRSLFFLRSVHVPSLHTNMQSGGLYPVLLGIPERHMSAVPTTVLLDHAQRISFQESISCPIVSQVVW